tara:strand:- start:176 stop:1138 length:963 start_codon:yes stop_codon:yes gene_type:complete
MRQFLTKRKVALFAIGVIAMSLHFKWSSFVNVVDYLFMNGPYLSRTLIYSAEVLGPASRELAEIIYKNQYEDRHWYRVNLRKANAALRSKTGIEAKVIKNFQIFIKAYLKIRDSYQGADAITEDVAVKKVVALVNKFYQKHKRASVPHDPQTFLNWPFHGENHLIKVAATTTACGITAEATLTLLRDLGFQTRLLGVANSAEKIVFNHVLLEYYSNQHKKWIMLDPMVGDIAGNSEASLSAIEMIQSVQARQKLNEKWSQNGNSPLGKVNFNPVYKSESIIFFSRDLGPFKETFYYANSERIRERVKERVSQMRFRPEWL